MDVEALLEDFSRRDWQRTTDGTVRFAMIGIGWWTADFAIPAVENSDLCETTVLVSSSEEKATRVARDTGVEHALTYDDFHDGAAADEYDAVYVCTPNALHLPYVETAAKLDKDVLCEKPMEATVERAEELVEAAEDGGVTLMVAYRMHTEPAVRRAKELIDAGAIGEPILSQGNNSQRLLRTIPDPDQWRLNPDLTGYGTSVMDLGIYLVNTTRFLLESDPVATQATMDSRDEAFEDVPDQFAAFTVEFDDGLSAAWTASQHGHGSTSLSIVGTEGEIELDPAFHMETELTVSRGDATIEAAAADVDQMEEEFEYFAHCLLTNERPAGDGRHGLVDMRALEAIYRSAEAGETVEIGR